MARALVGKLTDTEHLRLERHADGVQQIGERPVARPLPSRAARGAHPSEIGEVRLDRRRQFRIRSRHHPVVAECGATCNLPCKSTLAAIVASD